METTVLFALFISLFLRAVLSLPVESSSAQDVKSVNKSYATFDTIVKRNKREGIVGNHSCSKGKIWVLDICVSIEAYNELKADDYDEITTEPQDENATPTTQATTMPHPGPVSSPDRTPHPQRRSSPGPTKRPQKPPRPKSTSSGAPTTPQPVPLQVSRAEKTSTPHTMTVTILLVLCVSLVHRAVS